MPPKSPPHQPPVKGTLPSFFPIVPTAPRKRRPLDAPAPPPRKKPLLDVPKPLVGTTNAGLLRSIRPRSTAVIHRSVAPRDVSAVPGFREDREQPLTVEELWLREGPPHFENFDDDDKCTVCSQLVSHPVFRTVIRVAMATVTLAFGCGSKNIGTALHVDTSSRNNPSVSCRGRKVFAKAWKDDFITWDVVHAAALTEYHCNHIDGPLLAARVFDKGMKKFGRDVTYILSHLDFLLLIRDENNARALFETVVGTFTPEKAKPIWERWAGFRQHYDAFESILDLEHRIGYLYPDDTAKHDLGFTDARKHLPKTDNHVTNNKNTLSRRQSYDSGDAAQPREEQ
ncbi:hypothetical protein C8R43DRAFT_1143299 [Mycena crocata]|nr:hypothetical protein C8R43DRAFT_1143299 [Mycena crocata]